MPFDNLPLTVLNSLLQNTGNGKEKLIDLATDAEMGKNLRSLKKFSKSQSCDILGLWSAIYFCQSSRFSNGLDNLNEVENGSITFGEDIVFHEFIS